jgi:hypothetical protein
MNDSTKKPINALTKNTLNNLPLMVYPSLYPACWLTMLQKKTSSFLQFSFLPIDAAVREPETSGSRATLHMSSTMVHGQEIYDLNSTLFIIIEFYPKI